MEHPTHGQEPETAYLTPWTEPVQPLGPDTFTTGPDAQPVAVEPRRSHLPTGAVAFVSAVIGSLATVGLLAFGGFFSAADEAAQPPPTSIAPVATIAAEPDQIVIAGTDPAMAEAVWTKVYPSVVTVEVGTTTDGVFSISGSGSGVVLADGYIATNHHVIEGTDTARVILQDGRVYDAILVGSDSYTDLAVLSVEAADLVPVEIGTTDDLAIGQVAIALGNPLGQSGGASLTVGVLSALSRQVNFEDDSSLFGMLQTDAPITSGSSGGALVDDRGRLIGITTAIGLSQAGAEGIGYAIPVDLVQRVTDEIIATGEVRHAFLGIVGGDHVGSDADGALAPAGAEVIRVEPDDAAAAQAGLLIGDVVTAIAGVEVSTMQDLVIELRLHRVGDVITLDLIRDGEPLTVTLTLDERPDNV